jgi:Protein of unknown function (DUF3632)
MNIYHFNGNQNTLVIQILSAREMGTLTTRPMNSERTGDATAQDSIGVWKDLPFLVEDMTSHWLQANMTPTNRVNFAGFLAKLCAVGIDYRLCGCALTILRDALETNRPIRTNGGGGEVASILELLPIANAWWYWAGNKIIRLSEDSFNYFPAEVSKLGELAQVAGVEPATGGFSTQRWLFWVDRLGQIETQLEGDDRAIIPKYVNNLVAVTKQFDCNITRQLVQRGVFPDWEFKTPLSRPTGL